MPSPIDWNDREDTFQRATGSRHDFQLARWPAFVLEVSDLHYNTDSAVLLPDAPIDEVIANEVPLAARRTAHAVLAACLRHAELHRTRKLLVAGHADTQGSHAHNLPLSHKRAKGVALLLRGERDAWRTLMRANHVADDKRLILTWLAVTWGWDTDPRHHPLATCVENLQRSYNDEFSPAIGVDGDWQAETWGAVYDIYQRELSEILEVDDAGLATLRGDLQFVPANEGVGCGEHFPIDEPLRDSYRSTTNRRVELVFFEESQAPEFPCHPGAGRCVPAQCRFYRFHIYDPSLLPVPAAPPRLARVPVHLRVGWRDPSGVFHPFPKDTPLKIVFDDASSSDVAVGEGGAVDLFVSRRRANFMVKVPHDGAKFIASAPAGSTEDPPERRVPLSGLASLLDLGFRAWRMPDEDFDFDSSDWSSPDASFAAAQRRFLIPQGPNGRVGTRDARVDAALDPHWQYVKLLYWDRWLKRRLSVLPVMLKGYPTSSTEGDPASASNWTTPEGCQCLPWVVRTTPRPDADTMLRFDTSYLTYVFVEGADVGSRKLVTSSSADDALTTAGAPNTEVPRTSLARMRYYDLPQRWEARGWFCKLASAPPAPPGGTAPPARGRYAQMAASPTSNANPLLFSLDDMVLVDTSNSPFAWTPTDRCALFSNTFAAGPNLSDIGLYKPDTANDRSYLTQLPAEETDRNYIADYPDWTRAVVAKGSLFAVWDQRTRSSDPVCGARAAVQRPDPMFPNPTHMPFSADHATAHSYSRMHDRNPRAAGHVDVFSAGASMSYSIGKCEVVILRCCDVRGGATELGAVFTYFPVFYDFTTVPPGYTPPLSFAPAGLTMTAAQVQRWKDTASKNIMRRLNGPDGAFNPGRARIPSRDMSALPLEFAAVVFLDPVPALPAPWHIYVEQPAPGNPVRSWMGSGRGLQFVADNAPGGDGWFTAAHEFGHGTSRNDEYMERSSSASLYNDGVVEWHTGSPYSLDPDALMNQNRRVRGRYFWHLAEHLRVAHNQDFDVIHGGRTYTLPRHPDANASFDASPFVVDIDRTHGPRGMFSLGLSVLGDDDFARTVLPARVGGAAPTDGLLTVLVKIEFQLHTTVFQDMRDIVDAFLSRVRGAFDQKFLVRGSVGGRTFENCGLVISPRALVTTMPAVPTTPGSNAQSYLDAVTGSANSTPAQAAAVATTTRGAWRVHFTVTTAATGTTAWHPTNRTLTLVTDDAWASRVPDLFADMLGIARADRGRPEAYNPIARYVMPGATVRSR